MTVTRVLIRLDFPGRPPSFIINREFLNAAREIFAGLCTSATEPGTEQSNKQLTKQLSFDAMRAPSYASCELLGALLICLLHCLVQKSIIRSALDFCDENLIAFEKIPKKTEWFSRIAL